VRCGPRITFISRWHFNQFVESAILFLSPLIAWLVDEGACTMKSISDIAGRWAPRIITGFTAAVFLDSLRFKFTDHPNTQEIFGRLDAWATSLGAPGLFDVTGLFSQYVIGTGELIASSLLIAGMLLPSYRFLQARRCCHRCCHYERGDLVPSVYATGCRSEQ
jgi:hypothetical protein